ncbi:sodium- and chloride-dependent glycine transporter 1 [Caerostris extrusa]|uniref:Sodium- and chloride-dependent glycine transporter 1 n=1 Tax=Caerostris extrusa TaxID=172846 RepID=A0AAV4NYK9_CAEEX|nr:sodium- and chloride-dependent glycine transporter 1 [Caerostris extrusa]
MSAKRTPKPIPYHEEKESTAKLLSNGFKACVTSKASAEPSISVPLPPPEDTSSTISSNSLDCEENKRAVWGRQLDFFLSCVGYAVGLGNIWRFPYLCYQSGGAWTLYYIYHSYNVVWATCDNWWNTENCVKPKVFDSNASHENSSILEHFNSTNNDSLITTSVSIMSNASRKTSSEEFWLYNVLHQSSGIGDLGQIQWPLALTLFIAWFVVFLCLQNGVKSSGKVVYVSATFPYVVLVCLLIRGVTLPGAWNGIVWGDAATQIFYSVGAAWGAVLTMASYNKFSNNVYRDAMLIPIINCGTSIFAGLVVFSIIGFMAYETGNTIEEVVSED